MSSVLNRQRASGSAAQAANRSLFEILTDLSLDSSCIVCLDAASADSYSGSGDLVTDLSSGGNDFDLGLTSSTDGDEPTFNGSAGGLSNAEYFSFDGSDQMQINGDSKTPTDPFHKNNATLTFLSVIEIASLASISSIYATKQLNNGTSSIGIDLTVRTDGTLRCEVGDGAPPYSLIAPSDSTSAIVAGTTAAVAISIDEAGGASGSFMWKDGGYLQIGSSDTWDGAYSAPSVSAAYSAMTISGNNDTLFPFTNGSKFYAGAIFNSALTKANLDDIWTALNGEREYV